MSKTLLVAGGAGYIGSHVCHVAAQHGFAPVVVDRIEPAEGALEAYRLGISRAFPLEICDIADEQRIREVIARYKPCAAICLAALIDVEQSTREPALYWEHNYIKFGRFLSTLVGAGIRHLVFSSTAAVYGAHSGARLLSENDPLAPAHPYGQSKLACELLLQGTSANHVVAPGL